MKMLLWGVALGAGCLTGSVIFHSASGQFEKGCAIGLINFVILVAIYGIRAVLLNARDSD